MKFAPDARSVIPVSIVTPDTLAETLDSLSPAARSWAKLNDFRASSGSVIALPNAQGEIEHALIGLGTDEARNSGRFFVAHGASRLPSGTYAIAGGVEGPALEEAALGWLLENYVFDKYKSLPKAKAHLVAPNGIDQHKIEAIAEGEFLTRDLINTSSEQMGPDELEDAARSLATRHGASINTVSDDALLEQNFPLIHTVGRASSRAPRLIEMKWGSEGPKLTLVGKGVCFDTGGLNIKPSGSMGLMKKDMGGAATVLGLAHMIMALGLRVQLRVLIPAVENSIAGNAFRPGDVLTARNGKTIEINNTDAEGRLVLADALAYGAEDSPDLMVSMATLTGAARVAVGPDLAPFYTDDDAHAAALAQSAAQVKDPVWRMPFHAPYEKMVEPAIADLDNAPSGGFAGSITAALFLRRFTRDTPYMHFDIYGWNPTAAPARPKGGVGQGARALLDALPKILGL